MMMRKFGSGKPQDIEDDFNRRLEPSFKYSQSVGNLYSGAVYLALCGLIDTASFDDQKRIGMFSYGSGCSSEFFSGIIGPESKRTLEKQQILKNLESRVEISPELLKDISLECRKVKLGVESYTSNYDMFSSLFRRKIQGNKHLVLKSIENYHRQYEWI